MRGWLPVEDEFGQRLAGFDPSEVVEGNSGRVAGEVLAADLCPGKLRDQVVHGGRWRVLVVVDGDREHGAR